MFPKCLLLQTALCSPSNVTLNRIFREIHCFQMCITQSFLHSMMYPRIHCYSCNRAESYGRYIFTCYLNKAQSVLHNSYSQYHFIYQLASFARFLFFIFYFDSLSNCLTVHCGMCANKKIFLK